MNSKTTMKSEAACRSLLASRQPLIRGILLALVFELKQSLQRLEEPVR
jgi:hypothetical protein